ncbi:MAG TPA: AMP-binding protein [Actinomycetota bacterium]|nr:AMP-binding protein [Actinomycetota bacterium]
MRINPAAALGDLSVVLRAWGLRPLRPQTMLAVGRQIRREGVRPHLVLTIHAMETPDRPALVHGGRTVSWSAELDRVRRLANHLLARGIGPGERLAIMLANRPEFVEAQAAALWVGATAAVVNPRAPVSEALSLLERTKPRLLITHRDDLSGAQMPILAVGDEYEQAVSSASAAEPRVPKDAEGKLVIFTSGTTGRPKGAVRSLDQGASLSTLAGFLRVIPFRRDDVHMVVCPLYHSSGSGFAAVSEILGNPLVLVERFSLETFCRTVQEHKVTTAAVVPTMLHRLCEFEDAASYDLSSLRVVVCTGAPLREQARERARALLGDVVHDLYGSTEMGWVSVATPRDQRLKPGSVGKPVPAVEVRIQGPQGEPLPAGEVGEVWARSNLSMQGYLDDDELGADRVRDGFVSVKDLGYLDADGYLFVVDRADDMIISGGVNVYPAEAEVALNGHPAVSECAVVGLPDDRWGQKVVAAVVPRGDVGAEELLDWCRERVSYAAVPKEVRFVLELPRNDIGKVATRQLAQDLAKLPGPDEGLEP